MSTVRPDPVRLDQTLERIGSAERADISRAQLERFGPVWRDPTSLEEGRATRNGLVDEIFDFIMPEVGDPGLFEGSRYLDMLEDLAGRLRARDEAADRLERFGAAVLQHELKKHRLLWQYLNSLVEG